MSNRVNGDFQHDGDEEVYGDADSASVPTPPPSTFPPSTSSGYPNQQLSTASVYLVQRLNFDGEARVTMSRDEREEAGLHNVVPLSARMLI
jgi:hypothetical protein